MALVIMGTGEKEPIFHDFLGMSCAEAPVTVPADKGRESRASEMEVEASSAGGHALLSGTSDLVSERQGVNTCEAFHFNGRKNAMSLPEISTTFSGRKRSSSDSAYMGMVSDRVIPVGSDSLESSRLIKMLGKEMTGERLGKSHDDETVFSMQPPPRPTSLILHPPTGSRPDSLIYKWERSLPTNPGQMTHYPSRFAQAGNYGEKPSSSSSYPYRDAVVTGASLISQAAADEGSRTGIKSSGVLTVANPSGGVGERNSAVVLPCSSSRPKAPLVIEQDPSNVPSRHSMASASRQMTIFYAGQAHVFDDVHPNKADVIMALAGSNGVSWSTTYSPKPGVPAPLTEAKLPSRENEIRNTFASSTQGNSSRPLAGQVISRVPVITDSPKLPTAETRSTTIQAAGTEAEGKRDV